MDQLITDLRPGVAPHLVGTCFAAQLVASRVPLTDPPGDRLAEIVNLVDPRQEGRD
ncbi:MAG: hypothetical protein JO287_09350 [Pseudonocardiales bacterium]|nr:hypothetical protein [Pseudonocardiales bacterium]